MKILIIIIFTFFLFGCNIHDNPNKAFNWEKYIQKQCLEQLSQYLKDPASYQSIAWHYENIPYKNYIEFKTKHPNYETKFYNWLFINSYRAKNSFGGYNFGEAFFLVDSLNNVEFTQSLPSYINSDFVRGLK